MNFINLNLKKIDYIYHLSDIHFPKNISTDDNINERYERMIHNILSDASGYKYTLCVICGDLLNNNDQGSPELIRKCVDFINNLSDIMPVIIIAGNHDYNHINYQSWFDVIDIACNKNVFFLKESGYYIVKSLSNNILIGFQNITDNYYSFFYNNQNVNKVKIDNNCSRAIALFHGNVTGSMINKKKFEYDESLYTLSSVNKDYNLNKKWVVDYDLVLLGHIHERQKIEPNCYYAGSTIQRTFAENYDKHGGFIFNLNNLKRKEINYNDSHANIVLNEIDAKLHSPLPEDKKIFLRIHHSDSLLPSDRKEIEEFYNKNYKIINITWQYHTNKKINCTTSFQTVFNNIIANETPQDQEELQKLCDIKSISNDRSQIEIKSIEWSNIFCYGPNKSRLDFTDIITIINAPNTSGKSTIWRIILVALYTDVEQRTAMSKLLDNIVNKNAKEGYIKLHCTINNCECEINRVFKNNNSRLTHTSNIIVNGVTKDKIWLKDNLIPLETLISNYSITKDSESICSKTVGKFQKYLNDTFNVDNITESIQNVSDQIKEKKLNFEKSKSYLSALEKRIEELSAIDLTEYNERYEELLKERSILEKPINKYKLYNNISCKGLSVSVPSFTQDEYMTIANFYINNKINQDVINIYCKYNNVDDLSYMYNNYKQSEKINNLIKQNNLHQLSIITNNYYNDNLQREINKYKHYITDEEAEPINIQEVNDYLCKTIIIIPKLTSCDNNNYNQLPNIFQELPIYKCNEVISCNLDNLDYSCIKLVYEVYKILCNDCKIIECKYMLTDDILLNVKNNYLHSDLDIDLSNVKNILKGMNYSKVTKVKLIEYLNECCNLINNMVEDTRYIDLLKNDSQEYYDSVYTNCCRYICSYNEYARMNNKILRDYHVNMINKCYKSIEENNNKILECAKSLIVNNEEFNVIINNISNWITNILSTVNEYIIKYEEELDKYNNNVVNISREIAEINTKIKYYNDELVSTKEKINKININDLENEIYKLEKYKLSLENTRVKIIKEGLNLLENHINNELQLYIQYKIEIIAKEDNKNITKYSINIKNCQTNQYILHDNLSGYEKAILQFVIMHIINSFSSYSFNLFYIDEAFDVFDEDNFRKSVPNLLQIAADYTSNVLFVTHRNIPFMHSNYVLKTINKVNNYSTI
jgi:DNA repair exonuclease SbcCD nuclease subunit